MADAETAQAKVVEQGPAQHGRRLGWLDALRGVAVLAVVFEHLSFRDLSAVRAYINPWFSPGLYGVMVFFMVSGYIVPASLERRGSVRGFWVGRVFRLYPIFLVAAALKLVLSGFHLATDTVTDAVGSTLGHILMMQDLLGVVNLINVLWTLSYEMAFYLVITMLFVAGVHRASIAAATGFAAASLLLGGILPQAALSQSSLGVRAVAGAATAAIILGLAGAVSGHRHLRAVGAAMAGGTAIVLLMFNGRVNTWQGLAILAVMFTGTAIFRAERGQVGWVKAIAASGAAGLLAVASGLWHLSRQGGGPAMLVYERQWAVSILLAVVTFAVGMSLRGRRMPRFLTWLGMISYSVYLIHMLLIDLLVRLPWNQGSPDLAVQFALSGAYAAVLLGCCWLTYNFVEVPMQRRGRRLAAWLDVRLGPDFLAAARVAPRPRSARLAGLGLTPPAIAVPRRYPPRSERLSEPGSERQRCELGGADPARVGGVVARGQCPARDRGRVVVDFEDRATGTRPLDRADQRAGPDGEPGLLADFADDRGIVALPGFDPAARY